MVSEALTRLKKVTAHRSNTRRRRLVSLGVGRQINSREHKKQDNLESIPGLGPANQLDEPTSRATGTVQKNVPIEANHCTHVIFLEDGTRWDTDIEQKALYLFLYLFKLYKYIYLASDRLRPIQYYQLSNFTDLDKLFSTLIFCCY